ncbi:sensor histidine kinase [Larkinella terrae]|uniref:histidine kinase n=1 Tax=Larkinella terrae TaxID=2025311 RepID=A0A7K0EJR2_9BACT|nr:HAMP domain-containing sensor histidine kinase [Larkinella terrae]MRS61972.1 sensor histidine kinase [Larkinella terrae]
MKVIKETLYKLIGRPDEFSLEARIFNAICIFVVLNMGYNIPFSFLVGIPETAWICTLLFLFGGYVYYLSRIRNKFVPAITTSGIVVTVLFAVNYFYNSGMAGATLLSFSITLFLLLIAGPSRHAVFWVSINLIVVLLLLTTEYLYPESVRGKYPSRLSQTIDLASIYITNGLFLYFGTRFFTSAYKKEQKRIEERSVVLERLNAEKNKLFSIVSHDLRSPLASVQQYFEILKEVDLESEDRKKIESELLSSINYTQDMLFNLLSWSSTQMKGATVSLVSVNLFLCLKPVVEIYKPLAQKKTIQLDFQVDPTQDVLADAAMLQLIIRNLVGNAIKFTEPGGLVTIRAVLEGKKCLITVKDTGRGIGKEELAPIFSLKAQPTFGTNQERGVGLGLFLCKEYAEAQHGTIWLESTPSVGTTFFLSLPVPV